jgi:hypothetical protein
LLYRKPWSTVCAVATFCAVTIHSLYMSLFEIKMITTQKDRTEKKKNPKKNNVLTTSKTKDQYVDDELYVSVFI